MEGDSDETDPDMPELVTDSDFETEETDFDTLSEC
jgi:hypothetical protein